MRTDILIKYDYNELFIYGSFHRPSVGRTVGLLRRMTGWIGEDMETIVTWCGLLSLHSGCRDWGNHERSGWPVTGPRLGPGTSRTRIMSTDHSPPTLGRSIFGFRFGTYKGMHFICTAEMKAVSQCLNMWAFVLTGSTGAGCVTEFLRNRKYTF